MKNDSWNSVLYTEQEFHQLYVTTKGFNEDVNRNHRVRQEPESFAAFIDKGSTALIADHPELVKKLK